MLRCKAIEREIHLDASSPSAVNVVVLDPFVAPKQLGTGKCPFYCQKQTCLHEFGVICILKPREYAGWSWKKVVNLEGAVYSILAHRSARRLYGPRGPNTFIHLKRTEIISGPRSCDQSSQIAPGKPDAERPGLPE